MESLYVLVEFWAEGEFPPRAISALPYLGVEDSGICVFRSRAAAENAAEHLASEHTERCGRIGETYTGVMQLSQYLLGVDYASILAAGPYPETPLAESMIDEIERAY